MFVEESGEAQEKPRANASGPQETLTSHIHPKR
jgi:hypothetical protein